jgi:uncharacterized protein
MLIDQLKAQMMAAMKARDTVAKEAMRTAIGEITKTGDEATDERVITVLRKMVKDNVEALEYAEGDEALKLKRENELVGAYLPKTLDVDQVLELLAPQEAAITAAGNAGQATGIAMKTLKPTGAVVDGKTVNLAVRRLRGEA